MAQKIATVSAIGVV